MAKITYANKVALNENPSIADINKVNAADMNEIKTVVNGLVVNTNSNSQESSYSCDYINDCNTYSTDETFTGKYWINGKKIYRKIINFGALPNSTTKSVAHGISNLDEVLLLNAIAKSGTSYKTIPDVISTNAAQYLTGQIKISISSGNIVIYTESNQSSFSAYITIEYTKTTD